MLQIKQKDLFKNLAIQQHETDVIIKPPREIIYDKNGKMLAFNKEVMSAFILPHELTQKDKTLRFLKRNYKNSYEQIEKHPNKLFVWVERKLSQEKYAQLQKLNNPDIQFVAEPHRFYPFPTLSQVVGFTNVDNVGISGIELKFEKLLSGTTSRYHLEKDARSNKYYFKKELTQEGESANPLSLSIDATLQFIALDELKDAVENLEALSGGAIIMNPETGEILAMANWPYFNPNSSKIDLNQTKNGVVSDCFEFGSVIKAFTALAALAEGITTPQEQIDCQGKIAYFGKLKVENWKSTDVVSFADVIKFSSNVGVAKIADRLKDKFYDHLRRLGFGHATGIEFPGERAGFVNPPSNWSKYSHFVMSFGYEISGTLLQLARAFSIISNNGLDIKPTILKSESKNNFGARLYREKVIKELKDILEPIATKFAPSGFKAMGKTGTARVIENKTYSKKKHIYTFAGIIEKEGYKRVVITFIREPKKANLWAADTAAPLFGKIAERMVAYEQLIAN